MGIFISSYGVQNVRYDDQNHLKLVYVKKFLVTSHVLLACISKAALATRSCYAVPNLLSRRKGSIGPLNFERRHRVFCGGKTTDSCHRCSLAETVL